MCRTGDRVDCGFRVGWIWVLSCFQEDSARISNLEKASKWSPEGHHIVCVSVQALTHVQLFATPWTVAHKVPLSMGFPRQEYYKWVAISFCRRSSWPRDWTWLSCVSCIADRFFTTEPLGKPVSQVNGKDEQRPRGKRSCCPGRQAGSSWLEHAAELRVAMQFWQSVLPLQVSVFSAVKWA